MIDVGSYYRASRPVAGIAAEAAVPRLCWREAWKHAEGSGVTVGLLDTCVDRNNPHLAGADITVRNFTSGEKLQDQRRDHGTHSAAILVGQGRARVRGVAARSRLLVAEVVESDGVATSHAVGIALDWLLASGARIVAIPLGDSVDRAGIAERIEHGHRHGVIYFAASGNGHPDPVCFPARHPLVIAVGASDRRGNLLPDCSRSPRLDLAAPGLAIAAPVHGRVVRRRSGSSVACVVAAGVGALAISAGALAGRVSRTSLLAALSRGEPARPPPPDTRSRSAFRPS
jgi:subtilisin family serine protease